MPPLRCVSELLDPIADASECDGPAIMRNPTEDRSEDALASTPQAPESVFQIGFDMAPHLTAPIVAPTSTALRGVAACDLTILCRAA